MKSFRIVSLFLALISSVAAFAPTSPITSAASSTAIRSNTSLNVKFDKKTERWVPTTEDEKNGGYGPFGTLIR